MTPFKPHASPARGFTLVEIIVAITILAVILVSAFAAYSNIITINKRLELTRSLQENSRDLTEQLANDIREHGIDFAYYDGSDPQKQNDYHGDGTSILAVRGGTKYYPMKETSAGMILCRETDYTSDSARCFLGMENTAWVRTPITDERVKVRSVRFFLSGTEKSETTNLTEEWKATLSFTLEVANRNGVASELAKYTALSIQTTISEKIYKKD